MIGVIWLAIRAWGLWRHLAIVFGMARDWATRNPVLAALTLCCALLALCWHVIGVKDHTIARLRADKAHFLAAQVEAHRIAAEALRHQEAVYQAKANEADHGYQTGLADARSAADAFIASHRVHVAGGSGGASGAVGSAQGGGTTVPAPMPADAVVVSAGDVQACTKAVTYAIAAHNWASAVDPQRRNDEE